MEIKYASNLYKSYAQDGVILSYNGPFIQEIIEELTIIIISKLQHHAKVIPINKYLNLFIELSQNILRYSADSISNNIGNMVSNGHILVGLQSSNFYIISNNPIKGKHEIFLKDKLTTLEKLSKDELNEMYKIQLKHIKDHDSKGAGLGLIDIFRKADIIGHGFTPLDNDTKLLTLKVEFQV